MENKNIDVLANNEVNSNKLLTRALTTSAIIFAIICILVDMEVFYVYRWNGFVIRMILLTIELFLVAGAIYSRKNNYEGRDLKIILMGDIILAFEYRGCDNTEDK